MHCSMNVNDFGKGGMIPRKEDHRVGHWMFDSFLCGKFVMFVVTYMTSIFLINLVNVALNCLYFKFLTIDVCSWKLCLENVYSPTT